MRYIIEDRVPGNNCPNGWYGGLKEEYYDIFDLTKEKKFAKVFDNTEEAQKKADQLDKYGWNCIVLPI